MKYDPGELTSFRASDGNVVKIEHFKDLPSTVELAREYAIAGKADRYVVFAERQATSNIIGTRLSDGAYEKGIFMSIILRPAIFPSQAGLLGPLATTALVSAFEEHTTKNAGIGWISNVIYNGQKIGGCAIEGKLNDYSSYEYLIVSLALKLDDKLFTPRLTDMIRAVFDDESPSVSMLIAKTVLNKFFAVYKDIKNPSKHMDFYKQKFCQYGKTVKYILDGKRHTGKIVDVDKSNCTLIVADPSENTFRVTSPSSLIIPQKIGIYDAIRNRITQKKQN